MVVVRAGCLELVSFNGLAAIHSLIDRKCLIVCQYHKFLINGASITRNQAVVYKATTGLFDN